MGEHIEHAVCTVECPRPGCSGTMQTSDPSTGSYHAVCPRCGTTYNVIYGKVRSQSGHLVARGAAAKNWQIRYWHSYAPDHEGLLTFVGPRDMQLKNKDEFVCLWVPDDGHIVQVVNRTLNVAYHMWPMSAKTGCFVAPIMMVPVAVACVAWYVSVVW